jgi:hypothetical protein
MHKLPLRIAEFTCWAALAYGGVLTVLAQQPASVKAVSTVQPATLLPDAFAGWVADGAPQTLTNPAQADPASAKALVEYAFANASVATYKRDGETLTLHALHFHDASGAYGAYSFYRQNNWPKEQIGSGATSDHNRILFWEGNTVVDATFSKITAMTGSELRNLAAQLPVPSGTRALTPPILANLPQSLLDHQTTHYAVGPAGYSGGSGVLPADLIGFDFGAEAATANYSLRTGPATLTVIDYPTPQLASAQEGKIRAFIQTVRQNGKQPQPTWPKPLQDSDVASLEVLRSGPLVAIVSGDAFPEDSHKLISMVHYEADLTSVPQSQDSEIQKTGKLLLGIAALVIVGSLAAILLGFFLGGGRALYRIARGKPVSSVYEEEFTSLNLKD